MTTLERITKPLPKIGVIVTGGTIVMMRSNDGALVPPAEAQQRFESLFRSSVPSIATTEVRAIMSVDSANMTAEHWEIINGAVYTFVHDDSIDGVVVVHGTDTLAYSAAAVALALGPSLNKPVIFTGAQANPDVVGGDGESNIIAAIQTAASDLAEVAIVFGRRIIRGCCASKIDDKKYDAFRSVGTPELGWITRSGPVLSALAKRRSVTKQSIDAPLKNVFSKHILSVQLEPNNSINALAFDTIISRVNPELPSRPFYRALILTTLGCGNVPEPWISLIEKATTQGIVTVLVNPFSGHSTFGSEYLTGRQAVAAGAIPTTRMTHEMIKVKTAWAVGALQKSGFDSTQRKEYFAAFAELLNTATIGETGGTISQEA